MAWSAPISYQPGDIVNAASSNAQIRDNQTYLQPFADRVSTSSFADVTGSRVLGTTYQNTTAKAMAISISISNASTGTINLSVFRGATTADVLFMGYQLASPASGCAMQALAFIPAGWRYKATGTGGTLRTWAEWILH